MSLVPNQCALPRDAATATAERRPKFRVGPKSLPRSEAKPSPTTTAVMTKARPVVRAVAAPHEGYVAAPDVRALGLVVDSPRHLLWVGSAAMAVTPGVDSGAVGQAGLFGFDLKTGRLARRYRVGREDGPHVFGDITVSNDGDVYISDSGTGAIYRKTAAADTLEMFISPGVFASPQGLAFSDDGKYLYIADYSRGIMAVNMASSQVARVIAPDDAALLGIDGLARHENTLIAVQNGTTPRRVLRLRLDGFGTHIIAVETLDSAHPLMHEPTHGVVVGDNYYYEATSLWDRLDQGPIDPADATLVPPVVVKIRLLEMR